MNERQLAAAKKLIEAESGAAAAEGEAAAAASASAGPWLFRFILFSGAFAALYITRLRNPLYEALVGPEQVSLEYADNRAKLPLTYYWNSKSAKQTMNSRLRAMEASLGAAVSNSSSEKTMARVEDIRKKGYTNGIRVNLGRAKHFARGGKVNEMEKCITNVETYQQKGGIVDTKQLNEIVNLGLNNRSSALFTKAQQEANKGEVSKMLVAVSEMRSLQSQLREMEPSITEDEITAVALRGHTVHVDRLLEDARKIRSSGSRRLTEMKVSEARRYASANNVEFPEKAATQILGL